MKADRLLCISDLHLSDDRPDLFQAFVRFLDNHASHATALYILGDFFNAWIGDDDPGTLASDVRAQLRSLTDSGTAVFLMHGNRDFLLGKSFAAETGSTLIKDPHLLSCFDQHYLLMHGDSLCTRDEDYMAFRTMVRNPIWQQEFLNRPVSERLAFAEQARDKSKAMSSNKPEDIMDVTPDEVNRVLGEYGETTLVHGHTHRPDIHQLDLDGEAGKRIVLGDWDENAWWLELTPEGFDLKSSPITDLQDQNSTLIRQPGSPEK